LRTFRYLAIVDKCMYVSGMLVQKYLNFD
jgi:hypothetical protein